MTAPSKEAAREGLAAWREAGSPTKSRAEKFAEKPTRKLAVELFCISCMGGEGEVGLTESIRKCTSPQCSLFCYRPYK